MQVLLSSVLLGYKGMYEVDFDRLRKVTAVVDAVVAVGTVADACVSLPLEPNGDSLDMSAWVQGQHVQLMGWCE